jgi:hypothetical protein
VLGGCTYRLDSMFSRPRDADAEVSHATRPAAPSPPTIAGVPNLAAAAYAAVSEALSRAGRNVSVAWEDPATGARGTVTPLSSAYVQDGSTCRDFLASYVRGGAESWAGRSCRSAPDRWEVRQMRRGGKPNPMIPTAVPRPSGRSGPMAMPSHESPHLRGVAGANPV